MPDPGAVTVHIPEELNFLGFPLEKWFSSHPQYQHLVIGALIFGYRPPAIGGSSSDDRQPRLLLVKRSAMDSYPGCWEVPSGSVERTDLTISDAVAREVLEETKLRVSRFVGEVRGQPVHWWSRQGGGIRVLKLSFEVEVVELPERLTARRTSLAHDGPSESLNLDDVPVVLNPDEHEAYEWVTREELEKGYETGKYKLIRDQYRVLLAGFSQHKERLEQTERDSGEST
ncbi:hypothetical protein GP486_004967 [Trichoglossum hirsutum]|uniref:Nudix hydrolase domain-containing protein n=1 Tax=Trichoglossum hirsutum TaxID=265104 RepID=A0A9P8RN50_9PEZI|nr:hypothetical protein GP486_004967 [Trichoglossum hirsutum]